MNEVDLYCDVLRARLLSQEGLIRDYGTKAGVILGVGAAMMGAGAVILKFSNTDLFLLNGAAFLVMVGAFVLTAIHSTRVVGTQDWHTSPGMAKLGPNLGSHEEGKFTRLIGDAFGEAVDCNERVLRRKARILKCAIWSLVAEVIALVFLALVSLWLSGPGVFPAFQCLV